VPPEYLLGDRGLYMKGFAASPGCLSTTGLTTPEGAAKVLEVLAAFDPDIRAAKINLEDTYDNSFVERAAKKLQ
jgi:NitT/TauT family transport system substrate-binding protein